MRRRPVPCDFYAATRRSDFGAAQKDCGANISNSLSTDCSMQEPRAGSCLGALSSEGSQRQHGAAFMRVGIVHLLRILLRAWFAGWFLAQASPSLCEEEWMYTILPGENLWV